MADACETVSLRAGLMCIYSFVLLLLSAAWRQGPPASGGLGGRVRRQWRALPAVRATRTFPAGKTYRPRPPCCVT